MRLPGGNRKEQTPPRILVRTPNWLGDLMMATAFLGALLERFPDSEVDLITRKGFESLPLPHRGKVFPFDREAISPGAFGEQFRDRGYTHFFVMPPSLSSAWMAWKSGIPKRIGYVGQGRWFFLSPALFYRRRHRSVHLAREYLGLLRPFGVDQTADAPLTLPLEQDWVGRHFPGGMDIDGQFVVMAPGAEYGPAKQWPVTHYVELAGKLSREGWMVVVTGLEKDRLEGDAILQATSGGINLCGETDLNGLVALLSRSSLLVSNDSGAMHIAAALHRPQVAFFGSTNPTWTGPLNPRAEVIDHRLRCSPCYKRDCPYGHRDCLKGITPDEAAEHCLRLLNQAGTVTATSSS